MFQLRISSSIQAALQSNVSFNQGAILNFIYTLQNIRDDLETIEMGDFLENIRKTTTQTRDI